MFDPAELPTLTLDADQVAHLPTERLEAEMMSLAGHLAAATCSFLLLVAEFDRRQGYEDWEALSTAHWLNWRCGVSLSAAREQVRVARRLLELPVVRAAFASGTLSYSKVRAITRVATPDTEEGLVGMAQSATAAQMDRACAALRRTQDQEEAERQLRDDEATARARRSLTWYRTPEGDVVMRGRFPAEEAETVLAALGAATSEDDGDGSVPLDHRRADALVEVSSSYLAAQPTQPARPEIVVHVDLTDTSAEDQPVPWPITTQRGAALSAAALGRLLCDAGLRYVGKLPDGSELNLGRHTRTVTPAQRRALLARDQHCRFPGCGRRSRLHAHHIIFWEHGGPTDLENLLMLCPKHHRAVHEGGWTLTGTASDHVFTNPAGDRVLPAAPPLSGSIAELVDLHRAHGLDIALQGAGGRWHGERIDWDCFFAAFAN